LPLIIEAYPYSAISFAVGSFSPFTKLLNSIAAAVWKPLFVALGHGAVTVTPLSFTSLFIASEKT
jgi:hypothetical protein